MEPAQPRLATPARLAAGLLGLAAGAGALIIAEGPGRATTYAGSSASGAALSLSAGLALIAAAYTEALLAAAVLALFRDPYFDPSCLANCNVNIFLVRSLPSLARAAEIGDRWFTVAAAAGLIAICAARLVAGSRPAQRRL